MSTMVYYQSTFGESIGLNVDIIIFAVLITLLIFMELSQPVLENRPQASLRRLRGRFFTVTWILLIIAIGIAYTTVVLILATT